MPTSTFGAIRVPIVNKDGTVTRDMAKKFQEWEAKLQGSLNTLGQLTATVTGLIASGAKIQGRTEGIGTTVSQHDATGKLLTTDSIAADGTGSPLTGGKRGFGAINSNFQLNSTQNGLPVHSNASFTTANPLTQVGVTTVIAVAAWNAQFGSALVGVSNPGSVDPGVFGTFFVYYDNPSFGLLFGSATYFATSTHATLNAADGRICLGKITTAGGGGGTGIGDAGGGVSGIKSYV